MDDRDDVLAANAAFYRAFGTADSRAMEALLAPHRDDLSVVHPGAPAIVGRAGVVASWRAILDGADRVDIRCFNATACLHGGFAFVLCNEAIQGQILVATNIFCRTGEGWRLMHHQAGPCHVTGRTAPGPRPVLH